MPDASEQPSTQQPDAPAAPARQSQQQQQPVSTTEPQAQQQHQQRQPAPPPQPPPLPQEVSQVPEMWRRLPSRLLRQQGPHLLHGHLPACTVCSSASLTLHPQVTCFLCLQGDAPQQQQQDHPHGPPPKIPSFDQWAHDNAAAAHAPDGRTGGAIEPVRLPPSRHTAPASELPPGASDSSLPQQHTDAPEAPSGQPAAAMPDAPSLVPEQQQQQQRQAGQPWVPANSSRNSTYPDAPSAAASQASEQWHSAEQPSTEATVAPAAGDRPMADTTEPAASGSQQWQPPAAAMSDVPQPQRNEPDEAQQLQQQQPQNDWQQQQQQAPPVDQAQQQQQQPQHVWQQQQQQVPPAGPSMSDGGSQGDQQQQHEQQQLQRPAMSSFTPMSQFGTLRQQHQQQPLRQQSQQQLQPPQLSSSPHHSQQLQTNHSWPTNAQPQAEQYAPQQQQQQQQQPLPPQYVQQQHCPQQQDQQFYPQQQEQQGYPQQQQQGYHQQQQQEYPPQQQQFPQQQGQQSALQQHDQQPQQPQQPQPYHEVQQSVTRKPPVQEDYAWRDPAGDHRYQHNATGYQQDTYSTTLATIAAAKERWGNTTRWVVHSAVPTACCATRVSAVPHHLRTSAVMPLLRTSTTPASADAQVSGVAAAAGRAGWRPN